jgi:hypothetical protein
MAGPRIPDRTWNAGLNRGSRAPSPFKLPTQQTGEPPPFDLSWPLLLSLR